MSPTVFRMRGYRFYFFSREEPRMHIHVHGHAGEAKFWIEPLIELAQNFMLSPAEIKTVKKLIEEHEDEIREACDGTSEVEVTNVSQHGFWLLIRDEEVFLPFETFPWFRNAPIGKIIRVELSSEEHLYWPELDVDLEMDALHHPEKYPLVSKVLEASEDYAPGNQAEPELGKIEATVLALLQLTLHDERRARKGLIST